MNHAYYIHPIFVVPNAEMLISLRYDFSTYHKEDDQHHRDKEALSQMQVCYCDNAYG